MAISVNALAIEPHYHLIGPASSDSPQVIELKQGSSAPFSGILFGYKEEASIRKDSELLPIVQKRVDLYQDEITALQGQVDLWKTQAQSDAKIAVERTNDSFWKNAAFFALGVLATGLSFYAARKVSQ